MAVEKIQVAEGLVAYCAWYILNGKQQFVVVGTEYPDSVTFDQTPGVEATPLGKLSDQNAIFEQQIINGLVRDEWDFEEYPNPEIILLTDHRKAPQPVALEPIPADQKFTPDGYPEGVEEKDLAAWCRLHNYVLPKDRVAEPGKSEKTGSPEEGKSN